MRSAHIDTFASDNLPPKELWPVTSWDLPELEYPEVLNCAAELLDRRVEEGHGDDPVIHFGSETWSYRDLLHRANRIAHVLVDDLGLVPGNRVLLRGPNTPMLAACWFAVIKAGGICVTTMPLLRAGEIRYIIEKAKVQFALCDGEWEKELAEALSESSTCQSPLLFSSDRADSLESLMAKKSEDFSPTSTAREDIALIAFTSGTTGKAKGTLHSHRDVMAICDLFPKSTLQATSSDIFSGTPPLAFTFGLGGLLLFPMRVGASTVFLPKPSPDTLLKAIEEYRISVLFTSPAVYRAMSECARGRAISTLKHCVSAGETLPLPTFKAWYKATGLKLIDGIGATEMLHIFISASGADIRPGFTGKPIPGYQACLLNEKGEPVPVGEVGLLAVRGPTGCRYLDDIERQREYVRWGWNMTGDAYVVDGEGYFQFHSRADDMIIAAGYNISGIEVENALLLHPNVKECGVVGAIDPERGTIVKAFVVLRESTEQTQEYVKELQDFVKATIAPYKYPRVIEFVSELPRTETGKLQRFRLRSAE